MPSSPAPSNFFSSDDEDADPDNDDQLPEVEEPPVIETQISPTSNTIPDGDKRKVSPLKIPSSKIQRKKKKRSLNVSTSDGATPKKVVRRQRPKPQGLKYKCDLCNMHIKWRGPKTFWLHYATHFDFDENDERPEKTDDKKIHRCPRCDLRGAFNKVKVHMIEKYMYQVIYDKYGISDISERFELLPPDPMMIANNQ